jgi:hypothetical protein
MASIIVKWDKMGSEFTYSVLYAKHINGPWIRSHDFRLTDENIDKLRVNYPSPYNSDSLEAVSGVDAYQVYNDNLYMIDGLSRDTIYHVKVESNDKYHQWWYSYESQDSLGGGQSEPYNRPNPNGKNTIGLQFEIL